MYQNKSGIFFCFFDYGLGKEEAELFPLFVKLILKVLYFGKKYLVQ